MPHALIDLCTGAECSLLFGACRPDDVDSAAQPRYFGDLNLDQVVSHVTGDNDEFTLTSLFHGLPADLDVIALRQEVFGVLRRPEIRIMCDDFSTHMRRALASAGGSERFHGRIHADRWQLRAAEEYCIAVTGLVSSLGRAAPAARAWQTVQEWLKVYQHTPEFQKLDREASALQNRMRQVRYNAFVRGDQVRVGSYAHELAYEHEVIDTFNRFRPGENTDPNLRPAEINDYDPVRERIVEMVAKLNPDLFADAHQFCAAHPSFFDPTVVLLFRELQFYLAYLDTLKPLEDHGLALCGEPDVDSDHFNATETFDLALALQLHADHRVDDVVPNDVNMDPEQRTLVVTGPNQGGKTTLARTIGQLHHLAGLGCPVPGRDVRLRVPDEIHTHFDQAEVLTTQGSKLEEDLRTVSGILQHATRRSLVILNETFSSTTAADADMLGRRVLERLSDIGCRCVFVTFIDELSRFDQHTVSMASTVDAHDPTRRTFRVLRRRADGRAYAASLAAKYRLSYAELRQRIG